jgi:hypothetical protein
MKNSNDTIGNRTRDLPTCSAVPKPPALPRTPVVKRHYSVSKSVFNASVSRIAGTLAAGFSEMYLLICPYDHMDIAVL